MQTIHVSADFPLNRWGLIVVVMLAIAFALPVFAEEESSNASPEWAWSWMQFLSDVFIGAVAGTVAGVVTVRLAARLGLENFRKGMLHNKKAEIYERLLAAVHVQRDAYNTILNIWELQVKYGRSEKLSDRDVQAADNKAKEAEEEWFSAISAAELYLPPKSVDVLRALREKFDKAIEKKGGDIIERACQMKELAEDVQKQARKDIEVGK